MYEITLTLLSDFWGVLVQMAPYLLFGFLVAGLLSVLIRPETVERHLGGRSVWTVVKSALLGVPLPLCSCGVIPVSASLRRHGAGRGAAVSFLIATPQTGVDGVLVTYSLLGPIQAIFRASAALISGILGGLAVLALGESDSKDPDEPSSCTESCCTERSSRGGLGKGLAVLRYGFVTLPRDIGPSLAVGLAVAAGISALLPPQVLSGLAGGGILTMLLMVVAGIPIYVCATASVPIAAALVAKGIAPGAALVFLMTGPATNAATIATVWKTMGRRTAVIYLSSVIVTALAAGMLLDRLVIPAAGGITPPPSGHLLPHWVGPASATALLAVLGINLLVPRLRRWRGQGDEDDHAGRPEPAEANEPSHEVDGPSERIRLAVRGMTCSHCSSTVARALGRCRGVYRASADHERDVAEVRGRDMDDAELRRSVRELGFEVVDPAAEPADRGAEGV